MLKALQRLYWCRLGRFLKRRLAGFNPASKTLAEHADRAEFHCSRKLVAATRADTLWLRAHGLTALQPQPDRKQHHAPPSGAKSGRHSAWQTVVPFHEQFRVPLY